MDVLGMGDSRLQEWGTCNSALCSPLSALKTSNPTNYLGGGLWVKVELVKQALEQNTLLDTDIMCFTDAYDVLCVAGRPYVVT
jgi:hypothetical protein